MDYIRIKTPKPEMCLDYSIYGNAEVLSLLCWFGLFVHLFSHTCNTGHVIYRLQFTTRLVMYRHLHNTIRIVNNNTKFKDLLEVKFVTTSRFVCIYINIPKS
jgi:hypothetical protein